MYQETSHHKLNMAASMKKINGFVRNAPFRQLANKFELHTTYQTLFFKQSYDYNLFLKRHKLYFTLNLSQNFINC